MPILPLRTCTRVALLLSLVAPSTSPAQVPLGANVRSTTLDNGLQVIVVENPTIPFVTAGMVFRAGAFTQVRDEEQGIPHLIEHLLFRSSDSFEETASRIEASWNGITGSEFVRYYLTFPSRHLNQGVELLANLIRKPSFGQKDIDDERKVVRGELERRVSEPMALLRAEADMALWGEKGWQGKNAGGNIPALMGAKSAMLNDIYKRYYVPNNAAMIIAGDITEQAGFDLARRVTRGWNAGPDPLAGLTPVPIDPLTGIRGKVITGDVQNVTILVRWHGPSVGKDTAATYAADLFAALVNQPLSGTQVRLVDGGLVDDVNMGYETLNHVGPIDLYVRTSPERAVAAIEALGREIPRFTQAAYFDDHDLAFARKRQQVGLQYLVESPASAAHVISEFWASAGLSYFTGYAERLDAQTRADVDRFVNGYIRGKPMTVTVMVPTDTPRSSVVNLQRAISAWRIP
jgi:zinc protease